MICCHATDVQSRQCSVKRTFKKRQTNDVHLSFLRTTFASPHTSYYRSVFDCYLSKHRHMQRICGRSHCNATMIDGLHILSDVITLRDLICTLRIALRQIIIIDYLKKIHAICFNLQFSLQLHAIFTVSCKFTRD